MTFSAKRGGRLPISKGTSNSPDTTNGHVTVTIGGLEGEYGSTAGRETVGK